MPRLARRLGIWAMIVAPGIAVVVYATMAQQRVEKKQRAVDSFRALVLGLHNYHDVYHCLPDPVLFDDGKPRASWRCSVLAYVDASPTYMDARRPWIGPGDTEIDLRAVGEKISLFSFFDAPMGPTRIAAVVGPGSAFDEQYRCSFTDMDDDIILLVEVLPGNILWTEPGDYTWTGERPDLPSDGSLKIGSPGGSFHVAFKDGTVWRLSAETPLAELSRFFTVRGARENDRDGILGAWRR